jgi:hypothetical protein
VAVRDVLSCRQNEKDEAGEVDARDEIRHSPVRESRHGTKHQASPKALEPLSMIKTDTP